MLDLTPRVRRSGTRLAKANTRHKPTHSSDGGRTSPCPSQEPASDRPSNLGSEYTTYLVS